MSTATADEPKKDAPRKDPHKRESYDETVDVRFLNGAMFIDPVKAVPMYRDTDRDGKAVMRTWHSPVTWGNPKEGTELTDKDGVVWIVGKTHTTPQFTHCYVTKKDDKK